MRHLWQWFCGYVCVVLHGRQLNRFLNLCSKNGIHVWRASFDVERALRIHIGLKDFYELKPYLKKTKTKLRIVSKRGFPFWCHRHPKLKWMLVCVCVVLVMVIYSFNFIWHIEISGNNRVTTAEVMEYLEKQKIDIGMKSDEVNCSNVEYLLRENFNHFGWVSVYVDHTTLCIEVKESLYDPYEFPEEETKSYDLIAEKDAVIYSVITRSGKAQIKAGAEVKKGDILVKGQCDILDDAGEVKDTLYVKADATIWADTTYKFLSTISEMEIMSLKIAELYTDEMLHLIANKKFDCFLAKLEENGVIILDKNVMIDKKEKNILFFAEVHVREQIGINIPVEEVREHELE